MNNEGQRTSRAVIEQKLGESATVMDATGETIGGVASSATVAGMPVETTQRVQPVAPASAALGVPDQAADRVTATDRTVRQADDDIRVPVYEEEMVVGKRQEQVGDVHLRKEVVQEQESIPVTLRHEEVTVERVPVTEQASQADLQHAFQDQDIEVPVMGQEAVVGKQTQEVEEVRLHKGAVQEQQQVSGTVRKERVTVDGTDEARGAHTPGHQQNKKRR